MVSLKIVFNVQWIFCEVHYSCFNRFKSVQVHVSGVNPRLTLISNLIPVNIGSR
jgi:hypothetical protein